MDLENEKYKTQISEKIDELARYRERVLEDNTEAIQTREEVFELKRKINSLLLQISEEEEKSSRLLHENCVLVSQENTYKEKLSILTQLCRKRRGVGPNSNGTVKKTTRSSKPFSLRAVSQQSTYADLASGLNQANEEIEADTDDSHHEEYDGELLRACMYSDSSDLQQSLLLLTQQNNMLTLKLDEQRATYERERSALNGLASEHDEAQRKQLEKCVLAIDLLHRSQESCMRDLLHYRHETEKKLKQNDLKIKFLQKSLNEALNIIEKEREKHAREVQEVAAQEKSLVEPQISQYKKQLDNSVKSMTSLRLKLKERDETIEKLRQQVRKEKETNQKNLTRHTLELEGYRSDLQLMKQNLRLMEKKMNHTELSVAEEESAKRKLGETFYSIRSI
ncbi:hypothetical protein ADEAN_000700400 [Angomonas deanei]|uniref:Uncharacterized protein n=1 Tax=Angomonas deanei TaxID=59799 RepID=A0A7G2CIB1_9TRYP|nr:hypothetical protein ADEAN_000700400 [Angomonas deanei]